MHIAIIGGSGFVGNALTQALLDRNHEVTILSRNPSPHPLPQRLSWQVYEPHRLSASQLKNCTCVINLVGILNKRILHPHDFQSVHVELIRHISHACHAASIRRYLQISALHANAAGPSEYLKTKYAGEILALEAQHLDTTILRPSVIFGRQDSFLNRFAHLLKLLPVPIFPLACADTQFAPVYVGDLVTRISDYIDDEQTMGQCINLCGPKQYTLQQIVLYVAHLLGKRIKIISLPNFVAQLQGRVCDFIPGRPFSFDNYLSLRVDSVCEKNEPLCSTRMESIAPSYIKS